MPEFRSSSPRTGSAITMFAVALVLFAACVTHAEAQAPLSVGSLTGFSQLPSCASDFIPGMQCWVATVQSCGGADPWQLVFGFLAGNIPQPLGLVVFFSGGGGTAPTGSGSEDYAFAQYYQSKGYSVIQTMWKTDDWEYTTEPASPAQPFNIQNAACRPASFLHWARNNSAQNVLGGPIVFPQSTPTAGMCAQGFSAGSAALGYSLAYYGEAADLDKVILLSGPTLSTIVSGCVVPHTILTPICSGSEAYCSGWPSGGITESPIYNNGTQTWIREWTGRQRCAGTQPTTSDDATSWENQSIITGPNGTNQPVLSYSGVAMTAYLCESVYTGTGSPNESAPGGWSYLSAVGAAPTLPIGFQVNGVVNCFGPEGVTGANAKVNGTYATTVIEADMIAGTNSCKKNH